MKGKKHQGPEGIHSPAWPCQPHWISQPAGPRTPQQPPGCHCCPSSPPAPHSPALLGRGSHGAMPMSQPVPIPMDVPPVLLCSWLGWWDGPSLVRTVLQGYSVRMTVFSSFLWDVRRSVIPAAPRWPRQMGALAKFFRTISNSRAEHLFCFFPCLLLFPVFSCSLDPLSLGWHLSSGENKAKSLPLPGLFSLHGNRIAIQLQQWSPRCFLLFSYLCILKKCSFLSLTILKAMPKYVLIFFVAWKKWYVILFQ